MYYNSNKTSYHLPISSVLVQGNEPYSVQQLSSSISILVSALVFVIANCSQMDSFISFYSAHHSVLFAHHEHLSLIALVSIHLPINIRMQSLKQVIPQTRTLPSTHPGFTWQHILTAVTIPYFCVL